MAALFDESFLRRLEYLHIVSRKVYAGRTHAERRSKKTGAGLEFADHRDYSPGDDFRSLDWQVFARMERMLIKLYEEEEDLLVTLIVDCSRSMALSMGDVSKFHHGLRVGAALAYIALANLDRVSVVPFGEKLGTPLPPTRGKNQIFKIFRYLEGLTPAGPTKLNHCVRQFVHQGNRRGMAVIISDFYDPDGYDEALSYLRYNGFEPFVIHLFDEAELSPELRGDLSVVDCETGEVREITVTPRLLARYREVHGEFCARLEATCKARQASYFRTPVQVPVDEVVLRIFRAGGFVK